VDALQKVIDKFINWNPLGGNDIEHYSHAEFLEELERLQKSERNQIRTAQGYSVLSEERIHKYAADIVLETLIGKMKYGKRPK
jgi:hypothetical protein